ncbi:5-formyltetrahydrofolate cyclo-ligase [Yunchengibacter salinarum]|uniref:5-formyltetrahydrofolate cyclo-ligase n=1 Tax=Yunchengibacter salinarum TaxID=3133399 RepID=UPI0035B6566F
MTETTPPFDNPAPTLDKSALRAHARKMRAGARALLGTSAAEQAADHGARLLTGSGGTVALYWPMGDELDPRFLIQKLERAGIELSLPAVVERGAPLRFRRWAPGDPLEQGSLGTSHPAPDAPEVIPDTLVVPLLAFDETCHRLGYGGGYYDRTLAAHPHVRAFGYAYGAQLVDHLPVEPHDMPLHGVITEAGVVFPRKTG